ncbi:MAG: CinA family protein [Candidatus Hydrothermarchaeota archaeon]
MGPIFEREELLRYISVYRRIKALGEEPRIDLLHRSGGRVERLGVLQGSFDPLTVAHEALIDGALKEGLDRALILVPTAHFHKDVALEENSSIADRGLVLEEYVRGRDGVDLGLSNVRRFVDLIDPVREAYGTGVRLTFVFGLDIFEMVLDRKYYDHYEEAMGRLFKEEVLVAGRFGKNVEDLLEGDAPPAWMEGGVREFSLPQPLGEVSSTLVRTVRRSGGDCAPYLPDVILSWIERRGLYRDSAKYPMTVRAIETFVDRHPDTDPEGYLGDLEAVLEIVSGAEEGAFLRKAVERYAAGEADARGTFLALLDRGLSPEVAYGAVTGIVQEALVMDRAYLRLQGAGLKLALACVDGGGDMVSILQRRAGSSAYLSAGLVPYSAEAKGIVGVDPGSGYGAASMECARAMAHGLRERTRCDIALAETGMMPTSGGRRTKKSPGLVYMHVLSERTDDGIEARFESTQSLDPAAQRLEVLIQVVELGIKRVLAEVERVRPSP